METINRALIPQSDRLNRGFQQINRPDEFKHDDCRVRWIARTNSDDNGRLKTNIGKKTKDDAFTIRVSYTDPAFRGHRYARVILLGEEAEQAVMDGLKKGDRISIEGLVEGKVDEGHFIRMPYVVASFYEKLPASAPQPVPIDSGSGIEQI